MTAGRLVKCLQKSCWAQRRVGLQESYLIQEVPSVEPVPLGRAEAGVAIYSDRPSVRPKSCPSRFAKNQQQSLTQLSQLRTFSGFFALIFVVKRCVFIVAL